ncbi:conserved hypothetical protein [uncultured Mycobacterium sp.]|uniref:Uncharacterized protein n=1 Tax=uncultured Mycobacterium sp. TaxID=171292 RepID=A0A1Y5PG73_9MYCO|nr:conserved hypothetical protein [uncultured Mycobacterium sp.]
MVPDSSEHIDRAFRVLLNRALTRGQPPADGSTLGAATQAAITEGAQQHPEATVEHIIAA